MSLSRLQLQDGSFLLLQDGSYLLLQDSSGSVTPITAGPTIAIVIPDEVATGAAVRVWAEGCDNAGTVALDAASQITIWSLSTSGSRTTETVTTTMTASGEAYYFDWTPSADGTYLIQVAGKISTVAYFVTSSVSARPKFDPIALAVHDVLAARM